MKHSIHRVKIALVGCGVAGVSTYAFLVELFKFNPIIEITIFDSKSVDQNQAFNFDSAMLFMNTSSGMNSMMPFDEGHFIAWLIKENLDYGADIHCETVAKRVDFGKYLFDIFSTYSVQAERYGLPTKVIRKNVVSIMHNQIHNTIILEDESKAIHEFDYIIIGTGTQYKSTSYWTIGQNDRFLSSPYLHQKQMKEFLEGKENILIIGSRLTSLDAVLYLNDLSFKGNLTLASRAGGVPAIRKNYFYESAHDRSYEYACAESIPQAMKYFNQFIKCKSNFCDDSFIYYPNNKWEAQVLPFINRINELWSKATDDEKQFFVENYHSYLFRYLSTYYSLVHNKIHHLIENKKLQIKGGMQSVMFKDNQFCIQFDKESYHYDGIINAANINVNPGRVIKGLSKLLISNPINSDNLKLINLNIFLAGAITDHMCGISKAIYLIKRQAQSIATSIFQDIKQNKKIHINENINSYTKKFASKY